MSKPHFSRKWKYAAALSAAGFSLSPSLANKAHGYYALYPVLMTGVFATYSPFALTAAGVIFLTIKAGDLALIHNPEEGALAQTLLESGLLNSRSDLGMELALMAESPNTFEQIAREMEAGEGPALATLVRTTGISQEALIEDWKRASKLAGPVTNEASATRFLTHFLFEMGPKLEVHQAHLADFIWSLVIEQSSPGLAESGSAHKWLAQWMGTPIDSTIAATRTAIAHGAQAPGVELRMQINENPGVFLSALSRELESAHRQEIQGRVDELIADFKQHLSTTSFEAVGQPG